MGAVQCIGGTGQVAAGFHRKESGRKRMKTQADYKYLLDRKRGRLSSLLNALRMFAHNRRERKILNQPLRWD